MSIPSSSWAQLREEAEHFEYFTLFADHARLVAPKLTADGFPTVLHTRDNVNSLTEGWLQKLLEHPKLQSGEWEHRLIVPMRHGKSSHNVGQVRWGKAVFWRFCAQDEMYSDPRLGMRADVEEGKPCGEAQAEEAAANILAILPGMGIPLPVSFYTSPLRRCFETAAIFAKALGSCPEPTIQVLEDAREWLAFRDSTHVHMADHRSTRTEIEELARIMGVDVRMEGPYHEFIEVDKIIDVSRESCETFVDCELRLRRCLHYIFEDTRNQSANAPISLTLHQKSLLSFLSVIGERELELENAASIVYIVARRELSDNEIQARRHGIVLRHAAQLAGIRHETCEIWDSAEHRVLHTFTDQDCEELLEVVRDRPNQLEDLREILRRRNQARGAVNGEE